MTKTVNLSNREVARVLYAHLIALGEIEVGQGNAVNCNISINPDGSATLLVESLPMSLQKATP